ncbi:phosphoribosylanthranilate isomerase [bacterium]|nr:MAG: phosphoribosylanthranilate isomerase [bacterium]
MVKVKICGITNLEDAMAAVGSGCDAVGFLFYKKSTRYVSLWKVARIVGRLPKQLVKVGVFVNSKENEIRTVAKMCKLDMLQFHGDESPEFCDRFKGYQVIKAFRIRRKRDIRNISRYKTGAFLFDTYLKSKRGGTGEKFNWELISGIDRSAQLVFLSGGLNDKNVKKAIEVVHPDWVDVSSSVESSPGRKDHKKVRNFIWAAKGYK